MTTSLRATSCAICQQDLEPAQRWRCEVCHDYEVCGPCYSNGIINHAHTLISPPSPTGQLRAVLLHVTRCCTTQCQYPRCRTVKLLLRHGVTCKKRVCNHCKRIWDIFRMHARNCREPQCTIPKCSEFRARFSRNQQQADSRRRAAVVRQRDVDADAATASTPDSST